MCQKKIMRKRSSDHLSEEPPKKRISPGGNILPVQIPPGEILTDLNGNQWKLGKTIGYGGFGEIYLASDNVKDTVKPNAPFVIKVESHSNGPLFVEINCLLRIARREMVEEQRKALKMKSFGMPHYVASGSHTIKDQKLRFLVLPRYGHDLEKIFLEKNKRFNLKTVVLICSQVLDVLEYVHSKGYLHCDIKASNILYSPEKKEEHPRKSFRRRSLYKGKSLRRRRLNYNESDLESSYAEEIIEEVQRTTNVIHREPLPVRLCRVRRRSYCPLYNGRSLRRRGGLNYNENIESDSSSSESDVEEVVEQTNQVILIDYGLATKFRHSDGSHKEYCVDQRKAHAGTMLFCSVDGHMGVTSRRSDLEVLGYNMIYWLTSWLPWSDDVNNPEVVQEKKEDSLKNLDLFLKSCFPTQKYPSFIYEYFIYIKTLSFDSEPDYHYCKQLLHSAIEDYGYKNDGMFDFDNLEGWGKPIKETKQIRSKLEVNVRQKVKPNKVLIASNILSEKKKPVLRKKTDTIKKKKLNWVRVTDPEEILRQSNKNKGIHEVSKSRERKLTESSDSSIGSNSIHHLDIFSLNPTSAMLEVYNKCRDKNANYNSFPKNGKGDYIEHQEGFTPAMDLVLTRMNQRILEEMESEIENNVPTRNKRKVKKEKKNQSGSHKTLNGRHAHTIVLQIDNSGKKADTPPKEVMRRRQPRFLRNRRYGLRG